MYTQNKSRNRLAWQALPLVNIFVAEWQVWRKDLMKSRYYLALRSHDPSGLPFYPIDMEPLLAMPFGYLDQAGVLYNRATESPPGAYQPTSIAQYGLARWNAYLVTGDEEHKKSFMLQARWLVTNELRLADDVGGWLIPFPSSAYNALRPWLSALTQGNCISVCVRAYRLTGEDVFMQVARRAIRTFELDIQDGGVSASVGDDGIFFEEVAAFPAAHILNGYILALFGLYDYVELTGDSAIEALILRSLATFHTIIDKFDLGYWSCYDLHFKSPASQFYHSLHVVLLKALANYSRCDHCANLASCWEEYQQNPICNLRYFIASCVQRYGRAVRRELRHVFFVSTKTKKSSVPHSKERLEPEREVILETLHKK